MACWDHEGGIIAVYVLIALIAWLQGPYVYALHDSASLTRRMTPARKTRRDDSFDRVAKEADKGECDDISTRVDVHQYNANTLYWCTGEDERDEETTLDFLVGLANLGQAIVKRASEWDRYRDVSGTCNYLPLSLRQGQRLWRPRKSGILSDKLEGMTSI